MIDWIMRNRRLVEVKLGVLGFEITSGEDNGALQFRISLLDVYALKICHTIYLLQVDLFLISFLVWLDFSKIAEKIAERNKIKAQIESEETVGKLIGNMDARVWAKEFKKTLRHHPGIAKDEATMMGWFANAIMSGYDNALNKEK